MSGQSSASPAENAASTGSAGKAANNATSGSSSTTSAPKKPVPEGNPAFRMMGLPRLRLPSRNWLIFLSITGSFAGAVVYDKYQTRRIREKWCSLVSHIADEHLDTNQLPRRMTIYLAAPPGDGLRTAREHFHNYVKPVLVAAAMDWDVIEGRKEGDVRHKTAERIRRKRRKAGEGTLEEEDENSTAAAVEAMRANTGTREFEGIAGDLVVGRNTWKEYVRGLHEGWLGPTNSPVVPEAETPVESESTSSTPGQSSLGDVAVNAAGQIATETLSDPPAADASPQSEFVDDASPTSDKPADEEDKKKKEEEEKKREEEEKPKPRQPPPYIQPSEYASATVSAHISDMIGPSVGIRHPHLLGFRNTPIRIYRFLNRRHLADSIGRDVAAAILAAHRPYDVHGDSPSFSSSDKETESGSNEVEKVLKHEERDWWKTTYEPRKEHEESVWIEEMTLDERVTSRMRAFQLSAEDEDRAKRIWEGKEQVVKKSDAETE